MFNRQIYMRENPCFSLLYNVLASIQKHVVIFLWLQHRIDEASLLSLVRVARAIVIIFLLQDNYNVEQERAFAPVWRHFLVVYIYYTRKWKKERRTRQGA